MVSFDFFTVTISVTLYLLQNITRRIKYEQHLCEIKRVAAHCSLIKIYVPTAKIKEESALIIYFAITHICTKLLKKLIQ